MDEEDKASPSLLSSSSSVSLIAVIINDNDDYFLVIVVPTSTSQQKEKVEQSNEQHGCVINDDYLHLLRVLGKEEDGFTPADPTIQKIMRGLLAELIDLLSKDYEFNIIDTANNSVTYIHVPKTSSDQSFQNSNEWLGVAIKVAGIHGGAYEAV